MLLHGVACNSFSGLVNFLNADQLCIGWCSLCSSVWFWYVCSQALQIIPRSFTLCRRDWLKHKYELMLYTVIQAVS